MQPKRIYFDKERAQEYKTNSKPKPFTAENIPEEWEIKLILKKADSLGKRYSLIVRMMAYLGMRESEIVHLRDNWFTPDNKNIKIPKIMKCSCRECKREIWHKLRDNKTKKIIGKELYKPSGFWCPKTKKGVRVIFIPEEVRPILLKYFSKYKTIMKNYPNRFYIYRIIKRIREDLKGKLQHRIFPHCFRGYYCNLLDLKGFSDVSITNLLGWTKIGMAANYTSASASKVNQLYEEKWQ